MDRATAPRVLGLFRDRIVDAIAAERQVKGWSRAKKEALIRGDLDALVALSVVVLILRDALLRSAPQDEAGRDREQSRKRLWRYATPSFFCRLVDDVVYWNVNFLSG